MQQNSAYPGIFTFAAGVVTGGAYPAIQILPSVGATVMGWTDLLTIVTPATALAVAVVIGLLWYVEGGSSK